MVIPIKIATPPKVGIVLLCTFHWFTSSNNFFCLATRIIVGMEMATSANANIKASKTNSGSILSIIKSIKEFLVSNELFSYNYIKPVFGSNLSYVNN